jgi:hypothetical protein
VQRKETYWSASGACATLTVDHCALAKEEGVQMTIDTLTLVFLFAILGAMLWDIHRVGLRAHARSQEMLREIARFLGTDRR